MKVKELIAILQECDQELPVFGFANEDIHDISVVNTMPYSDRVYINVHDEVKRKPITLEHIIHYFEIDLDNCLLTKKDFCKYIHELIINTDEEIVEWEHQIEEYYKGREIDIWKG